MEHLIKLLTVACFKFGRALVWTVLELRTKHRVCRHSTTKKGIVIFLVVCFLIVIL